MKGDGERHVRKHDCPKRQVWRKTHIGIDVDTLEIRNVE